MRSKMQAKRMKTKPQPQNEKEEKDGQQNPEKRWGSREIEISNVKMFDGSGKEKYVFKADEPLVIEFDVQAVGSENDFVFGIGIFNSEGIFCYGSNTHAGRFQRQVHFRPR